MGAQCARRRIDRRDPTRDRRMVNLFVNGETFVHEGAPTVAGLLSALHAAPDRVAVMLNDRIIRKADRNGTTLSEGDRIEVVVFAGGG